MEGTGYSDVGLACDLVGFPFVLMEMLGTLGQLGFDWTHASCLPSRSRHSLFGIHPTIPLHDYLPFSHYHPSLLPQVACALSPLC
jgi:hypothetical protein